MTNAPKTVLAIHDLPGFGRAALSVIVPVLSTLGVQTVALPTAVLSTHTGVFQLNFTIRSAHCNRIAVLIFHHDTFQNRLPADSAIASFFSLFSHNCSPY